MREIDFLGKRNIAFAVSGALILASIVTIFTHGLNYGIDFVGGTELVVKTRPGVEIQDLRGVVEDLDVGDVLIQRFGEEATQEFLIRIEGYEVAEEAATYLEGIAPTAPRVAGWQDDASRSGEQEDPARPEDAGDAAAASTPAQSAPPTPETPAGGEADEAARSREAEVHAVGIRVMQALRDHLEDTHPEGSIDLNALEPMLLARRLGDVVGDPDRALAMARAIVLQRREQGILTEWSQLDEIEGLDGEVRSWLEENAYFGSFVQLKSEVVGPTIGSELRTKALLAIIWSLAGILAYVWFRFELRFSVASIVALVHDVIIVVGVLSLLGEEFSLPMIAALLTIVGYSLNDTIVVFDRVRENLRSVRGMTEFQVINASVNQTLSRTLLTSGTTLIVVVCLLILGGPVIHGFAMALFLGVLVGTYSSIYVASPVVLYWRALQSSE